MVGREKKDSLMTHDVESLCKEVCGSKFTSKSYSKICLVKVYPEGNHDKAIKMCAILDDQKNRSLARSQFFNLFGETLSYTLKTCAGVRESSGRIANGYQIEAINGGVSLTLPNLIEYNDIPKNCEEIPTPKAAFPHPHLKSITAEIPAYDQNAPIFLLLGRDLLRAPKVRKQISSPGNTLFAQKLDLGWVLVGEVFLGNTHKPTVYNFTTMEDIHCSHHSHHFLDSMDKEVFQQLGSTSSF